MSSNNAQRKASERARKRALGLKRHEWWLKPARPGQRWVPQLCNDSSYENPIAAAIQEFAVRRKRESKQ